MPFHEAGELRYFTFDLFNRHNVVQGIFTRMGGVSPAPGASLNLGGTVGDAREHVVENRQRIFNFFDRRVESVFDAWQVHGRHVITTEKPRPFEEPHQKADAILTDRPEVTLLMRFADCVPLYLYDPVRQVIGQVHAGWRGTINRIAQATVEKMTACYGTVPGDMLAGIGPSICVEHYPVGHEVGEAARDAFGPKAASVLWQRNGAIHLDLWQANQIILEECGVRQIEQSEQCTFCHNEEWYSHRAEKGKTGRFGAIFAIS